MCLSTVIKTQLPTKIVYQGYKVFDRRTEPEYLEFLYGRITDKYVNSRIVPRGRWIKAIPWDQTTPYDYGFHVFRDLEDAKIYCKGVELYFNFPQIYRVKCRGLVTVGTQLMSSRYLLCRVFREIKVGRKVSHK